jgi:Protein of unknown function (DUF1501)
VRRGGERIDPSRAHTDVPNHEPGLLLMHSGVQQPVRPSLGSWVCYGLGNENEDLPSFVVLAPRRPGYSGRDFRLTDVARDRGEGVLA